MNSVKKAAVFPFDYETSPLLRHRSLIKGYEITCAVSPASWQLCGKDAGFADCGPDVGINVYGNLDDITASYDTLILAEPGILYDFEELIRPAFNTALAAGKDITCLLSLRNELKNELAEECKSRGLCFEHIDNSGHIYPENQTGLGIGELEEITVPVIFVLGSGERTLKFEVQLSLRESLMRMGYKVSQVGTRQYCGLLGFHSFPAFMGSMSITEENKILLFNHFIKNIEIKERPDVIIVGIPGGTVPYDSKVTNRFGLTAYEISEAAAPDAGVFCAPFINGCMQEYLENLLKLVKYKFSTEIDCFNIANVEFDLQTAKENSLPSYLTLDYRLADKAKAGLNRFKKPVFNVLNPVDSNKIADSIIDALSANCRVEIL